MTAEATEYIPKRPEAFVFRRRNAQTSAAAGSTIPFALAAAL